MPLYFWCLAKLHKMFLAVSETSVMFLPNTFQQVAPPTFWAVVPLLTWSLGQGESVLLAVGSCWTGRAVGTLGEAGGIGPGTIWAAERGVCGWRSKDENQWAENGIVITILQICLQLPIHKVILKRRQTVRRFVWHNKCQLRRICDGAKFHN